MDHLSPKECEGTVGMPAISAREKREDWERVLVSSQVFISVTSHAITAISPHHLMRN